MCPMDEREKPLTSRRNDQATLPYDLSEDPRIWGLQINDGGLTRWMTKPEGEIKYGT